MSEKLSKEDTIPSKKNVVCPKSTKKIIDCFDGEYAFLSNFYEAPIIMDGIVYPTNEHAFQAMKTKYFEQREIIAQKKTPGQAKRAGRNVMLRDDWEQVKDSIMKQCIIMKFVLHPHLKEKLLATGDAKLVEGNTWNDTYWGVCNGVGKNRLGTILMEVRDLLKCSNVQK